MFPIVGGGGGGIYARLTETNSSDRYACEVFFWTFCLYLEQFII